MRVQLSSSPSSLLPPLPLRGRTAMVFLLLTAATAVVLEFFAEKGYLGRSAMSAYASASLFRAAHPPTDIGTGERGGGERAVLLPWGGKEADAVIASANSAPLFFRSLLGTREAQRKELWRLRSDLVNRPDIGRTVAELQEKQGENGEEMSMVLRGQLAAIAGERAVVGFAMASFLLGGEEGEDTATQGRSKTALAKASASRALLPRGTTKLRLRVRCPAAEGSEAHKAVYSVLVEAAVDGAHPSDSAENLRSFQLDFTLPKTSGKAWTEVVVPLAALRPNFRGRTMEGVPPPKCEDVRALGVAVLRSRQAEPARPGTSTEFALEIQGGRFEMLG